MVTSILPGPGTFHLLCHPLVGLACVHADTTPGILGNEWPRKLRSTLKLSLLQIESYLLEIFVITAVCFRGKCSKKRIKQRSFFSLSAKFQRILSRANPFTCLVCPGFTYCAHFHSKHDFAQQCAVFKYFGDRNPLAPPCLLRAVFLPSNDASAQGSVWYLLLPLGIYSSRLSSQLYNSVTAQGRAACRTSG